MLGKTRHGLGAETIEHHDPELGPARGVLRPIDPQGRFAHMRRAPSHAMAYFIELFWMVSWDLTGCEPQVRETLPHPSFHLTFENGIAEVHGIATTRFVRRLQGRSHVFGVKFLPGAARSFLPGAAMDMADRSLPARDLFGLEADHLASLLANTTSEDEMVAAAQAFLAPRLPPRDPSAAQAARLVAIILNESAIKTVDDLAARTGVGKRSLQRLFHEYVGATPKWVIRRYRLHELLERFHTQTEIDWPQLALELGYFDQAHLINDFRSIMGRSPGEYQRNG